MCRAMMADPEIHDELQEKHFRKRLAATLRKIQWSYAIFWSISSRLPGVLAWGDGYYNGEIKTRKMTQHVELKADEMDLQRSEQLRELYESLSAGDSSQQARRPSASLSPEDLTGTEWYYLVCMSFTFTPGQGLPGKAFVNNQHLWLSNAQYSDSKLFSRSLLAKSASIQTVVCIPFMGGVLELGTTEMVVEDPALVEQITGFFWALPVPAFTEQSVSSPEIVEDEKLISNALVLEDQNLIADMQTRSQTTTHFSYHSCAPSEQIEMVEKLHADFCEEELKASSPGDRSNDCFSSQHLEDFFGMDDEFSNGLHCSWNSNEYASMSFVNANRVIPPTDGDGRIRNQMMPDKDHLQEGSRSRIFSLDLDGDDSHYAKTVAAILCNSRPAKPISYFLQVSHKSDFMVWRRGLSAPKTFSGTPQRLLKKILVSGEVFRDGCPKRHQEDDANWQKQGSSVADHVLVERKKRENLSEKFLVLQSLIPSISKADKATIVGDAIEYLKDLERRVQELESCRESAELERASDPCGNTAEVTKKGRMNPSANKRKSSDFVEAEAENYWLLPSKAGPIDVNVTMNEKEVAVEMRCPWRDCLVLELVESISHFHLDPHSMQSSIADGMLALTIKSKIRGSIVASPGMIKRSLQKVIGKCL